MRFLLVDRILSSTPGKHVLGLKHITPDEPYLSLDEEGRLYFTTALVGEALGQLAAWNVMAQCDFTHRPVAGIVASVTVNRKAYVGETLLLESVIDALDATMVQYHSTARVGEEMVLSVEGAIGPLLPMEMFISQDKVRRQYHEINRPGEISLSKPFVRNALGAKSATSFTFDTILHCEPNVSLVAVKCLSRMAAYFPDHFPYKPVLPMTVLLECQLNLAREFIRLSQFETSYTVASMRRIKMNEFVYPGDIVTCQLNVKNHNKDALTLSFLCEVEGKRVCVMELLLVEKT